VEDLLARLDAQAVADVSADLAEIILDARYPDVPGQLVSFEQDRSNPANFFEPISLTANTNIPLPAPRRSYRLLGTMLALAMFCGAAPFAWQLTAPLDEPPSPLVTSAPAPAEIVYSGIVSFEGPEQSTNVSEVADEGEQPHDSAALHHPEPGPSTDEPSLVFPTEEPPLGREALRELVSASEDVVIRSTSERQEQPSTTGPYGTWAASPNACTPRMQRRGHLLTRIYPQGARAGDTVCTFERTTPRKGGFDILASCSDGKTTWRSNVRLSLNGGRLTWASEKGATIYVRCLPR
jgi:hypothetical protein